MQSLLALIILVLFGHASFSEDGGVVVLSEKEQARLVEIAQQECRRLNVPIQGREVMATVRDDRAIIVFKPPLKERAGEFIIQIERATGKVVDTNIWR